MTWVYFNQIYSEFAKWHKVAIGIQFKHLRLNFLRKYLFRICLCGNCENLFHLKAEFYHVKVLFLLIFLPFQRCSLKIIILASKMSPVQVFSSEILKVFQRSISVEHLWITAGIATHIILRRSTKRREGNSDLCFSP